MPNCTPLAGCAAVWHRSIPRRSRPSTAILTFQGTRRTDGGRGFGLQRLKVANPPLQHLATTPASKVPSLRSRPPVPSIALRRARPGSARSGRTGCDPTRRRLEGQAALLRLQERFGRPPAGMHARVRQRRSRAQDEGQARSRRHPALPHQGPQRDHRARRPQPPLVATLVLGGKPAAGAAGALRADHVHRRASAAGSSRRLLAA